MCPEEIEPIGEERHRGEGDNGEAKAGVAHPLVAAHARQVAARQRRADHAAAEQRDETSARGGGVESEPQLEEQRQVDGRGDDGEHRQEQRSRRHADDAVGKDAEWQERLGGALQMHGEPGRERDGRDDEGEDGQREPGRTDASQRQRQHQREA